MQSDGSYRNGKFTSKKHCREENSHSSFYFIVVWCNRLATVSTLHTQSDEKIVENPPESTEEKWRLPRAHVLPVGGKKECILTNTSNILVLQLQLELSSLRHPRKVCAIFGLSTSGGNYEWQEKASSQRTVSLYITTGSDFQTKIHTRQEAAPRDTGDHHEASLAETSTLKVTSNDKLAEKLKTRLWFIHIFWIRSDIQGRFWPSLVVRPLVETTNGRK